MLSFNFSICYTVRYLILVIHFTFAEPVFRVRIRIRLDLPNLQDPVQKIASWKGIRIRHGTVEYFDLFQSFFRLSYSCEVLVCIGVLQRFSPTFSSRMMYVLPLFSPHPSLFRYFMERKTDQSQPSPLPSRLAVLFLTPLAKPSTEGAPINSW